MLRKFCFFFIFLNNFYYYVKFNSVCVVRGEQPLNLFNSVLNTFNKYVYDVKNFFRKNFNMDDPKTLPNNKDYFNLSSDPELLKPDKLDDDIDMNMENNVENSVDNNIDNNIDIIDNPNADTEKYQTTIHSKPTRNIYSGVTMEPRHVMPLPSDIDAAQLIVSLGFKSESHTVLTSDGYMLTIQRIVPELKDTPKQAVILHHGILGSSEDWLILGPGLGLPFLLSDRGYDVWLLNARGNKYSKGHTMWYTDSYEFWNFTWHEIGIYDLPATISYISEYTNDADLYFVAHSMGASALLALLSTIPEYNKVLKSAIFLAPLAFMNHAKGPMKQFSEIRRKKGAHGLNFLGTNEFLPSGRFPQIITEKYCKGTYKSCQNPVLILTNGGIKMDPDLMYNIMTHVPAGGSAMTIMHYIQLVKSGRFQSYDHGVHGNLVKYKRKYPPKYALEDITLSISLFTSPSDWLSSMSDVTTLESELKNIYIHHVIRRHDFSHMDFVWAKDAPELVFGPLMDILEEITPLKENGPNKVKVPNDESSSEEE